MDRILALVDKLDKEGQLGPVMTKWNAFWTNKLGADLTGNQDYVRLAESLGLMNTALGVIHGGARGGGSIQMKDSFKENLNVEKMDASTLRAAIETEREWLNTYANPAKTALPGPGQGAGVLPVAGQNISWSKDEKGNRIGKDQQGKVVLTIPAGK
jgi:hypothetical protein